MTVQIKDWRLPGLALSVLLLFGCAGNPPKGLEAVASDAPSQRAAQAAPDRYRGATVRWGGEILGVSNKASLTEVEVFARPLFDDAAPRPDGGEGVRFIARVGGFLDPADYRPGKRFTVRGRLAGVIERAVGEYPYRYPLVEAVQHHLWPAYEPAPPPAPYYDPWWPWGPWGPYRRWPYGW